MLNTPLLQEADPETRQLVETLVTKMNPPAEVIAEGLDTTDVRLVKALYERIRDYIQGSVLIAFLENRRQTKALQRELADLRRQYDRDMKLAKESSEEHRKKLDRALQLLENLQIPVEKGADYGTQRRQYWNKQVKLYELVEKIARKLGITIS